MNRLLKLVCVVAAGWLIVAERAQASGDKGLEQRCEKNVASQGHPNAISAVASLNAVRAWIEFTMARFGADYAMWHNAAGKAVKCQRLPNSSQIKCIARARPCNAYSSAAASKPLTRE